MYNGKRFLTRDAPDAPTEPLTHVAQGRGCCRALDRLLSDDSVWIEIGEWLMVLPPDQYNSLSARLGEFSPKVVKRSLPFD